MDARRGLWLAGLALTLSTPSSIRAQDPYPPTVTILPSGGSFTTAPLLVTVYWCDNGNGSNSLDAGSMAIVFNGANVSASFSYEAWTGTCETNMRSVGTVTLVPGPNTLQADICDWGGPNCGSNSATYTYTPSSGTPLTLVAVTPDYQAVEVERSQSYTQWFTVQNNGNAQATYTITRTCTGSGVASGCTPASQSLTLPAGQQSGISIAITASATAGTTGLLKLTAALTSNPTIRDSGLVDLLVTPLNPPGTVVAAVNPGVTVERDLCLTIAAGSGAAYECADLRLVHTLPPVQTLSKPRVPTLLYNSNQAHPVVRLAAQVTLPNDGQIPDSVTARLLFSGVQQVKGKWVGSNWAAGSTRRIVLSFDALSKATGLYPYSLEVTRWYPGSQPNQTVTGELVIVNRQNSPFGAGWWLAELDQLIHLSSSRKLWIGGDGSTRVFDSVAVNLWRSPSVDRPEELSFDGTYYCRKLPHRGCVLFDVNGFHKISKNRLADSHAWAHRTFFDYDGSNRLSTIRLPISASSFLTYTFAYDAAGKLDSIIAPPAGAQARVTQATVTTGRLMSVRDPDNTLVSFAYDGGFTNRVLTRTDRRGTVTTYSYGSANTLTQASIALDGGATIVTGFAPQETKGLAGTTAVAPSVAFTKLDAPRTDVGDTTRFWLDRFGAPAKIRDALGNETVLFRGDVNFPALVTRIRQPNGRVLRATYDVRGNIVASRDSNVYATEAVTTYAWDTTWDFVTSITVPTGEVTQMGYNSTTGNREWQRPGTDPSRNVSFLYNSLLLLAATQQPGTGARDSIMYDALGNVSSTRSPLGFSTLAFKDGIGRDTLVHTPLDPAGMKRVKQRVYYDKSGQDTLTISFSDSTVDSSVVRKHFDAEGNVDSVWTRSGPDTNHIGWVKRAFSFDRANRQTTEALVGFYTIPFTYDPAGNLTNGGRRGGANVTVTYDALNRPIKRQGTVTATYTYDAMGNVLTANNPYARITRAYLRNGALEVDTLRIAGVHVPDSNFSLHVYAQRFRYDSSGRRVMAKHPAQLVTGADSVTYSYDSVFGQLKTVRDPFGNLYRYTVDVQGRVTRLTRLAQISDSVYETMAYDLESRLARRVVSKGPTGTLVRRDSSVYDARDKIVRERFGTDSIRYAPLGPVLWSRIQSQEESFLVDALGNRTQSQSLTATPEGYVYQAASGRLLKQGTMYNPDPRDSTFYSYEWDGANGETNRYHYWRPVGSFVWDWERRVTLNTYDVERQLVRTVFVLDSSFNNSPPPPGYLSYQSDETYRYDALGRRVYTRGIRGPNCINKDRISGCRSTLTRTVWDGNQILFEIRVRGDSSYAQIESDVLSPEAHYGTVGYLHAGGIDQPLALWKGTQLVQPHANWRGVYMQGTCPSTDCSGTVWFPATTASVFGAPSPLAPDGPPSWHGSLIESGQDASGYQYRRNRYYDPKSGRFTQEDPIGLAGGLNLYGFADGDPVTFSDPFGLCPPYDKNPCNLNTGDANLDNPSMRQDMEDSYFLAPEIAGHPGYVAEVGGWCRSEGTCTSRTDGNPEKVWLGERPRTAIFAWHTHGNAGKRALNRGPDDYYAERWSGPDLENAGGRDVPSYIIGPRNIIRLTPLGNGKVHWQVFPRWTKPCRCNRDSKNTSVEKS